jgi:hypothetical protein
MPNPTFITSGQGNSWSGSGTKTGSIAVTAGDQIVTICIAVSNNPTFTPSDDASNSYSSIVAATPGGTFPTVAAFKATASTSATINQSVSRGGDAVTWGYVTYIFRNATIGASASNTFSSFPPGTVFDTLAANSAVVFAAADFNATDGATRTYRTINSITPTAGSALERAYQFAPGVYTVYSVYWNDVGAAGSQTVGMLTPDPQRWSCVVIEVQGVSAPSFDPKKASQFLEFF